MPKINEKDYIKEVLFCLKKKDLIKAKALIPFHRYGGATKTSFEEHLEECLDCFGGGDRVAAHFTVAPEYQGQFEDLARTFAQESERGSCHVTFSLQHPETDTIGMNSEGGLLRTPEGEPLLRPGGHGSLIENLHDLHGDLIFVKNCLKKVMKF